MQMQRQRDARLDLLDDLVGGVGRQQSAHVFQANDLHAHVGELFRHMQKIIRRMHRTDGVTDRAFDQFAGLETGFDGGLHVAHIVHGIEDAKHVDAVGGSALHEGLDDIVGIVFVADHVLAAQEHLKAGLGHGRAQFAQALPGAFFEKAQRRVESRAAPGFQRPVADIVELRGDRQHVFGRACASRPNTGARHASTVSMISIFPAICVGSLGCRLNRRARSVCLPSAPFPWRR